MNIYYYLFYKLSGVLNKKGKNEWGPIAAITFFPFVNIITVFVNTLPNNVKELKNGYGVGLILIGSVLFITNTILFLNKKRYREIQKRFQGESLRSKMIGKFVVLLYITPLIPQGIINN